MTTMWIVVAGAMGCLLRWSIEEVVERRVLSYRAFATMAVNILGALITGFVVVGANQASTRSGLDHFVFLNESVILTGFCGGFTTFSSAIAIPYLNWIEGAKVRAAFLIGVTPLACIAAYAVGGLIRV